MDVKTLKTETLKERRIPEWFWTHVLSEQNYVEDALLMDSLEEAVEFIVSKYDEHVAEIPLRHIALANQRGEEKTDEVEVSLSSLELERKAALEEYLALCAACDADVYLFRKKVLGGQTISSVNARKLIGSPAARVLSKAAFENLDIPFLDHTAKLVDHETDLVIKGRRYRATIFVDPPSLTRQVEMVTWSGTPQTDKQRLVELDYPDEEGKVRNVQVWSISLLGELREVGEKLSERYRWQSAQAVWFVLTGEIPAVPALRVTRSFPYSMYHHDALITVEASPWVSSRTVEKAFRKAQAKTLGSRGGRRIGEKNLKLLRFVIEHTELLRMLEGGRRPPDAPDHLTELELVTNLPYMKVPNLRELVSGWNATNATNPKWIYKKGTSRFWRDYKRARKIVAFGPHYQ
jgi:hypothetical protein